LLSLLWLWVLNYPVGILRKTMMGGRWTKRREDVKEAAVEFMLGPNREWLGMWMGGLK
jgi:hypothetical protein